MNLLFPPRISANQGADQQHAGAGGSNETCKKGAKGQDQDVAPGGAQPISLEADAPRHNKQGSNQHHKGDVFSQEMMHSLLDRYGVAKIMTGWQEEREGEP